MRFVAALLLAIGAWGPPLRALLQLAIHNENYSYTLLVFAVSALLLGVERWGPPADQRWPGLNILFVVAALGVAVWRNYRVPVSFEDLRLTASILLFVIFVLVLFAQIYGWESFSRMRFSLLFLLLAVPLPPKVILRLVAELQRGSADVAYALFRLFRVPVARYGLVFSLSNIDIEVAQQCSGIRSSTILFVTTLVLAQMFLKSGWSRAIAVISSLPIAVAKNGLRIFVLSLLGNYVSERWLQGSLHRHGGILFFTAGMASVLAIIWLLRREEELEKRRTTSVAKALVEGGLN
jgi:exosortase